jgi:hypothetical protein
VSKKVDIFPAIFLIAEPDSLENYADLTFTANKPSNTRRLDRCRVAIFNGALYVVVDSPEGHKVVFREKVADYSRNDATYHALTVSGKICAFTKDHNCGCGSRLRSWSPFGATLSSIEDPDA